MNTLLTCRHYYISIYYTAQRFMQVDALLRQVTSAVIDCDKTWRLQGNNVYDAWEMENATNTTLLTPIQRKCWFVRDSDYGAYDTLACVGNLKNPCRRAICLRKRKFSLFKFLPLLLTWTVLKLPLRNGCELESVWRRNEKGSPPYGLPWRGAFCIKGLFCSIAYVTPKPPFLRFRYSRARMRGLNVCLL